MLNGAGDITWTRQVASQIQSLAYTVKQVRRADRFDYPRTAVYYGPGGRLVAVRLARQLGVVTKAAAGRIGTEPTRGDRRAAPRRRLTAYSASSGARSRSSVSFARSPAGIRSLALVRM